MKFYLNKATVPWRAVIKDHSRWFQWFNGHTMRCQIKGMENLWFKDNNQGDWDTHAALDKGGIPMADLLAAADRLCPEATLALEVMEARSSVDWLESIGAI